MIGRRSVLALLALAVVLPARAGPDWKAEFEDICSKTQDAMALGADELRSLVARCDKLKPKVEALGETERKVYLRRLQSCRDLYAFVLESMERGAGK